MNKDQDQVLNQIYSHPRYTEPFKLGGIELRPLDLLEHVLITGRTGSGKTRSCLMPLTEAVVRRFGNGPEDRAAVVVIDAKADMVKLAGQALHRAGRTDDLLVLGENGNCWFSLFEPFNGDVAAITEVLVMTLEDRTRSGGKGDNEAFWEENMRRLLRASISVAKARHGCDLGGLSGITAALNSIVSARDGFNEDNSDEDERANRVTPLKLLLDEAFVLGRLTQSESRSAQDYLHNDVLSGSTRTWGTIANYARNFISQFASPALLEIFEPGGSRRRITPDDVIDEGLMLVVSLSPALYGAAALPFRMAIKKAFCDRILQRDHLETGEGSNVRPINQTRPVLYVMDEFHTTLSPRGQSSEAYFLDRAREFRCMCLLATQGVSAIAAVIDNEGMRHHILNNVGTKFFFASDCIMTLGYFEQLGGEQGAPSARRPAPPRFRLPGQSRRRPAGVGFRAPSFRARELGSLSKGVAYVVTQGRTLRRFERAPDADMAKSQRQMQPV